MEDIPKDDAAAASPAAAAAGDPAAGDSGLLALLAIARFHHLPADAAQLRHQFAADGRPFDSTAVQRAGKALGLKMRAARVGFERLTRLPMPLIAVLADGRFLVVGKAADDKVLALDPASRRTVVLDRAAFAAEWTGGIVLATPRRGLGEAVGRFDVRWFLPAILKYRRLFGEVLLASFFLQVFALVTPLFFQVVVDKVLVHRGLTTLDVLVVGLVAVSVFEVLLTGLRGYIYAHTTSRIDARLGVALFGHLLALPVGYFAARRVGDTVARARELETIREFLTGNAVTVVLDLLFGVVFVAVMWHYSATLTLLVLATLPLYIGLSVAVTPVFRRRLEEKFNRGAENQAFLVEAVSGIETLKAMAVEPQARRRWEDQLAGYVAASFRVTSLGNLAQQCAQLINKLTVAGTLWFGARLAMEGGLTIGELVAFNMLAARLYQPVLRLAQLWQDFQQVRIAVARLGDILNAPAEPAFSPGRGTLPRIEGEVRLEHVSFRYRPDTPEVLSDLSLAIRPGQVIGLVGPSGSGKSTLTKLVQRLHVPERGRVLVDGVDLALVDTAWLRRQIGVVLQENVLFNRSVRDNIALARPGAPLEQVIRAARLAGAHEFITALPYGYDSEIGERGSTLSGGQRQRIAIARALMNDPRILILDEATSALDYESERIVQANMRRIAAGRTVIIIAHRLAAVRDADRIVTIEGGRVVEDGSHDELLRRGGRYARLWRYQAGAPLAAGAAE